MNNTLILNLPVIRPFVVGQKFNLKALALAGLTLAFCLICFYIFQINEVTRASFAIASYDKQLKELDKEFKSLQVNYSGLSSLSNLEAILVDKGYEKVGKVQYIQVLETTVASTR